MIIINKGDRQSFNHSFIVMHLYCMEMDLPVDDFIIYVSHSHYMVDGKPKHMRQHPLDNIYTHVTPTTKRIRIGIRMME